MTEPGSDGADCSEYVINALRQARSSRRPVTISAGDSKRHLAGRECECVPLDLSGHRGIID